jgi:hypothetical protein
LRSSDRLPMQVAGEPGCAAGGGNMVRHRDCGPPWQVLPALPAPISSPAIKRPCQLLANSRRCCVLGLSTSGRRLTGASKPGQPAADPHRYLASARRSSWPLRQPRAARCLACRGTPHTTAAGRLMRADRVRRPLAGLPRPATTNSRHTLPVASTLLRPTASLRCWQRPESATSTRAGLPHYLSCIMIRQAAQPPILTAYRPLAGAAGIAKAVCS